MNKHVQINMTILARSKTNAIQEFQIIARNTNNTILKSKNMYVAKTMQPRNPNSIAPSDKNTIQESKGIAHSD